MRDDDETEATLDSHQVRRRTPGVMPTLVHVFDGGSQRVVEHVFRLDGPELEIGRHVDGLLDVPLQDRRVSRRHLRVLPDPRRRVLTIEPLSDRGARHNGVRVDDAFVAHDNDVIRVGSSLLVVRFLVDDGEPEIPAGEMRGRAPSLVAVRRTLAMIARADRDLPVLLLGESGTGKEVAARRYAELCRPRGPFVAVNCGAIPEALAESELFGHVAGAFTGAQKDHPGVFRRAHGGTLLLDEVGELPSPLQAKLLRALEQREVTPVGGKAPLAVDVRVVSATNRDLQRDIDEGAFRGDLYARLAGVIVHLPPLRERREDILPLLATELGQETPPLEADLAEALLLFDYPYNVRELKKLAGELAVLGQGKAELSKDLVEERLRPSRTFSEDEVTATKSAARNRGPAPGSRSGIPRPTAPSEVEVRALLKEHDNNVSAIARVTGRSRTQVYRWLKTYGIPGFGQDEG